jgi:hypothetical protein
MPAATELSTIDYQLLVVTGGARDWGAALLLVRTWVWVSVAVLLSASQLLKQSELA